VLVRYRGRCCLLLLHAHRRLLHTHHTHARCGEMVRRQSADIGPAPLGVPSLYLSASSHLLLLLLLLLLRCL
jgi:hypothetical protein